MFPNPSSGSFTLNWPRTEPATVYVYNTLGALVLTERVAPRQPVAIAEKGTYFVTLVAGTQVATTTIVVQ